MNDGELFSPTKEGRHRSAERVIWEGGQEPTGDPLGREGTLRGKEPAEGKKGRVFILGEGRGAAKKPLFTKGGKF